MVLVLLSTCNVAGFVKRVTYTYYRSQCYFFICCAD